MRGEQAKNQKLSPCQKPALPVAGLGLPSSRTIVPASQRVVLILEQPSHQCKTVKGFAVRSVLRLYDLEDSLVLDSRIFHKSPVENQKQIPEVWSKFISCAAEISEPLVKLLLKTTALME